MCVLIIHVQKSCSTSSWYQCLCSHIFLSHLATCSPPFFGLESVCVCARACMHAVGVGVRDGRRLMSIRQSLCGHKLMWKE